MKSNIINILLYKSIEYFLSFKKIFLKYKNHVLYNYQYLLHICLKNLIYLGLIDLLYNL